MAVEDSGDWKLVEKHPRAIRWMHWVNFPVLAIMVWSGLLIYWGDSIPPYQHPHEVYRVGIGSWTLFRLFPDWFWNWMNAPYQITTGLGWHFLVMWFFALNGIAYVVFLLVSGEWRVLWPHRRSFADAIWVTLYDMHVPFARRKGLPPQGKYNGAQRIAYTAVVLMGAGSLMTGLAIYKPTQAHWLTTMFGGYEMARWFHFWLTMGFCGFFLVHVGQVVLAGWNNFRSMVSGYEIQPALFAAGPAQMPVLVVAEPIPEKITEAGSIPETMTVAGPTLERQAVSESAARAETITEPTPDVTRVEPAEEPEHE